MARYIDADKFERELKDRYYELEKQFGCYDSYVEAIDECIDKIDNAPTADVQEVKHGKWITHIRVMDTLYQCSICAERGYVKWYYCPYCGAKMDGDEK